MFTITVRDLVLVAVAMTVAGWLDSIGLAWWTCAIATVGFLSAAALTTALILKRA